MINSNLKIKNMQQPEKTMDLYKTARLGKTVRLAKVIRLAKIAPLSLPIEENSLKITKKAKQPPIVGEIRHYPPANKEWKNSIYAYNKNSLRSTAALDKIASRTIKSYFNLTNNRKLARSFRMRNLIRRTTSKRIFTSKPEIKQTSNKVNITVYTFNREGQFLLRKLYFYKKNMNINRDIYLHKIWLKKNLLAFKQTFKENKSIRLLKKNRKLATKRTNKNKTYIHNILIKRYLRKNGKQSAFKFSRNSEQSSSKRNLIRSLKIREKKNISRYSSPFKFSGSEGISRTNILIKNPYLLSKIKPFENYLMEKRSRKIKFKLRNSNSVIKIKKKLSRFFYLSRKRRKMRLKKIRLPYSNLKFKNEIKFFSFKLVSELKYIRKLFLFFFIKYILSLLQINIKDILHDRIGHNNERSSTNSLLLKVDNKKNINKYSYNKLKRIDLLNLNLLNFLKLTVSKMRMNHVHYPNTQLSKKLRSINNTKHNSLLHPIFLRKMNLELFYKKFEKKYFLIFLAKFFKKEFLYINYYTKFLINKLKFGKFLPGLKYLINKIYSKKVELNIVNLKYPQLNSDIYADSIASKLKKKLSLLRVLRSSLNLAKLPSSYLSYDKLASINELRTLTIHKSLNVNDLIMDQTQYGPEKQNLSMVSQHSLLKQEALSKDKLDEVLNNLYPYSLVYGQSSFASDNGLVRYAEKSNNIELSEDTNSATYHESSSISKNLKILNIIKYKWVSGVRLEAAGRLTRRYTAARSVFKFRYKGSLKNIDYSQKDITKRNISTVMLRNSVKSNSQYSFSKSKRRIGAFGLKAWIASY